MTVHFVDLKKQYKSLKEEMDAKIHYILDTQTFIGGKNIHTFEDDWANICGAKHCLGVANGTDAIFIALKMIGVGSGDEIITSAQSWISTSEVISLTGATPVFVDIAEDHLINPKLIEKKITNKTKAIIPVHLYGQMADMKSIKQIASKHDLPIIEDCAQAHLAERDAIKAGTTGIAGTFSFYPGKNLGAYGDAGGIISNDEEFANRMRMFSRHGGLVKHSHHIEGMNSRLDNIQAGVLNVKLPYLREWTERRRELAQRYFDGLADLTQIQLPVVHDESYHVYHLFVISVKDRDRLKINLAAKGIATQIHYPNALPFLKCYQQLGFKPKDYPVAYEQSKKILSLPLYPELTNEEQDYVIDTIKGFYS
ncbi:DegT/DnrJ/EryC1/StrS family aminotransferase [Reichenbachiella versicolor]|uniref:DegT/DnrJ/EryC1/StrS family aminotransferase n=1 Tax=Reichenbachiella versicolor TaxID=1821036 RepID=UPI000D6EA2A3|nr:DegT/DnrJ/EryC1/StrS family aminotransferase [Reichenbachiella versicolor]